MNHNVASFLHYLAGIPAHETRRVYLREFADVVPAVLQQGFVEVFDPINLLDTTRGLEASSNASVCVEDSSGDCIIGLRLTDLGRELVMESLCAMETAS